MKTFLTRRSMVVLGIVALSLSGAYATISLVPWSVGICAEDDVSEALAPNGGALAKAFRRNCGATTGYVTHVNLRRRWSYFNPRWVGTINQGMAFVIDCDSDVQLNWRDGTNLEVQYEACARDERGNDPVFMKSASWGDVNITFNEIPRPSQTE